MDDPGCIPDPDPTFLDFVDPESGAIQPGSPIPAFKADVYVFVSLLHLLPSD